MNTADVSNHSATKGLTDAFKLFNQLSQNLSASYQSLEVQVAQLNRELATARGERLKTLMEKEKIATRLQQLLAALPAGVVVLNSAETILDCNHQALGFLGESLLGMNWDKALQQCSLPVPDSPDERFLRDGRRVNIKCNRLANEAGQIVLISDVTELRTLQELLAQQRHLSAMGEMVASLAHQIRTPLSTAILYASQIYTPAISDEKRSYFAEKILERLHHLERQVNDMLVFAKQGRLAMDEFSLADLFAAVNEQMRHLSIRFSASNHAVCETLRGNRDALLGALANLLNNAVQACDASGEIDIEFDQVDDTRIKITIKDNGRGMDAQQQRRLFEPFFTTKPNGTGLGLAVVKRVVVAHSGSVECVSIPEKGTVFTIILPIVARSSLALSKSVTRLTSEVTSHEHV